MNNAFDLFINGAVKQIKLLDRIAIGDLDYSPKAIMDQADVAMKQLKTIESLVNEDSQKSRDTAWMLWDMVMKTAANLYVLEDELEVRRQFRLLGQVICS